MSGRLPDPATEQTLFASTPSVQWPGCVRATMDGPVPSFPCPRYVFVAVGNWKIGPTPQISFPGFLGVMEKVGCISPKPYSPVSGVPGAFGTGWLVLRVIHRTRRLQYFERPVC